jgi:hypothetical protein
LELRGLEGADPRRHPAQTAEWGEMPSHWSIYVLVPDVDACTARAAELG